MLYRHTFIVDASYNYDECVTGIGIAIHETDKITRGRNGILIDQISESYLGIISGHGEMLALYRALEIANGREYKNIRLRSDCNEVVKALKKSYLMKSDYERAGLYGELMRITRYFDSVDFGHKPRRKNQMAHNLSRVGSKDMEPIRNIRLINICSECDSKLNNKL